MLTLDSLERRSSVVCVALGSTLVLSLSAGALAQSPIEPTWRFTLREGASVPSTVTLVNRCREPHRFRIDREEADFAAVDLAAEGVIVAPGASREVAVRFDADGKGTGRYTGALVVACADCAREPGCSQDRDVFGIEMTVVESEPPALEGVAVHDGVLVFADQEAFDRALRQLDELFAAAGAGRSALDRLEAELQFVSLRRAIDERRTAMAAEGRLTDANDPDHHFVQDPALRSLFNRHGEIGVGRSLFRLWDQHLAVEVQDGDGEAWQALRAGANPYRLSGPGVVLHPLFRHSGQTSSCVADFKLASLDGQQASFTSLSTGARPLTYAWDFGDGTASSEIDPTHTFGTSPSWNVCLRVLDADGCSDEVCHLVNGGCYAHFSATFDDKKTKATFANHSLGEALTYSWSFGDGASSSEKSPVHTYTATGDRNVCLTVSNSLGCEDKYCQFVQVGESLPCCDANDRVKVKWTLYDDGRKRVKSVLWLTSLPLFYSAWGARTINEVQGEDGGWRRARAESLGVFGGGTLYLKSCTLPAPTSGDKTEPDVEEVHIKYRTPVIFARIWTRASSLGTLHEVAFEGQTVAAAFLTLSADCERKNCKKSCRTGAKTCKKTCRESKDDCRTECKSDKDTCLDGCSNLKGKAKRDCKQACRSDKRTCKSTCKETKTVCAEVCTEGKKVCRKGC